MLSPFHLEYFLFVCNWLLIAMFIYSLFELEISVNFYVIDVIFDEKLVIGESVDFVRVFVFI